MIPTARDLMETHVIAVNSEASLLDVYRLFVEEEISGAPVVDDLGTLVGVVTSTDLLRATEEEHDSAVVETDYLRRELPYTTPDWAALPGDFQDRLRERRVSEVMTPRVVTVPPEASAPEIARTLRQSRIHRVFVISDSRLVGIVSSFDILRLVEDWKEL